MARRHPDVDDREVGLVLANEPHQRRRVACLPDHLEPGPAEQAGQPLAQQDIVVGQHHPGRVRAHLSIIRYADTHEQIRTTTRRSQRYRWTVMNEQRARDLLSAERKRIEQQLRTAGVDPNDELSTTEIADGGTDTYQSEFDEGRLDDLRAELAAVERAEQRLAEGTFGRSVESGRPIPDERLEALPTAERTVEEEERRSGGR